MTATPAARSTITAPAGRRPRPHRHWQLAHLPALDGLRGFAVAGVLLYHGGYLTGGYLGVDLFFVLSGFLITSLLLTEREASGGLAYGSFWARRARRLLPALFLLIFGVVVFCLIWARPVDLDQIRGDALAALLYVSNWRAITGSVDYWAISKAPSPLQHLWSLAIEEQFYLVWPIVFGLSTRRLAPGAVARRIGFVALVGAGLSLAAFALLHAAGVSDTRIYEGTDTRAFAVLCGALVACWRELDRRPEPIFGGGARTVLRAIGPLVFVLLAIAWIALDGRSTLLYAGGLPLCSVLAALVVAASVIPGGIPWVDPMLRSVPLRRLGLISYGLYLWHWPVYLVLNEVRVGFGGVPLLVLRIAVSIAIAVFSYVVVEQPIRTGAISGWKALAAIPASMAALALLMVVVTSDGVSVADANQGTGRRQSTETVTAAPRVLYLGDSVAGSLADYPVADPSGFHMNAYNGAQIGCGLMYEGNVVKGEAGDVSRPASCTPGWPALVAAQRPNIVVILFGAGPTPRIQIGGEFRGACDPEYRTMLRQRLAEQVAAVGTGGAKVVLVTNVPTTNPFRQADADEFVGCVNETIGQVAQSGPAEVVDLAGFVCPDGRCKDTIGGKPVRPDSTHFHGPGGAVAARWLADQVRKVAGYGG